MSKRAAATKKFGRPPVAKKIKTEESGTDFKASFVRSNEVLDKVKLLMSAFNDEEQVGLLSISHEAKDLLQSTIPSVLGEGSAADQRHEYQTRMANAIGSTLSEAVKNSEDKVSEAKDALKAAESGHAEAVSALAAAKRNVEERAEAVKSKKEELEKSLPPITEEEENVARGEKEVEKFLSQLTKKREDRDKFQATLKDTYEVLKAFEWDSPAAQKKGEKKLLTALESTLKKLKADSSMFVAIRNALTKAPSERSKFDCMAMDQVEQKLNGHLHVLEEQLASAEKTNAEKIGICAEAAANLEAARKYRANCKQEHDAAKTEKSGGEADLRTAKEKMEIAEVKLVASRGELEGQEGLSNRSKETVEAFTFLYERRINPESPLCPSPCGVAVQKVEPTATVELTATVEKTPAAMEVDHATEEPVSRASPARAPTDCSNEGSPRVAKSPAQGSPAKDSSTNEIVGGSPRVAKSPAQGSPAKDSSTNETVRGSPSKDLSAKGSPAKVDGSPGKDLSAKGSPAKVDADVDGSPGKDLSTKGSPAKVNSPVASVAQCADGEPTVLEEAMTQEETATTLPEDQMTEELPESAPMEEVEEAERALTEEEEL